MNLPDGEGLYLTIDRVVERECQDCDGQGYRERSVPEMLGRKSYTEKYACEACGGDEDDSGTGRRKVRVRGWCKPEWYVEIIEAGPPSKYTHLPKITAKIGSMSVAWVWGDDLITEKAVDAIIAAHFAKTLPDGAAHITEEDAD